MAAPIGRRSAGQRYDVWLIGAAGILLALGLVMVASASITLAERLYDAPLHYFQRQSMAAVLGLCLGFAVLKTPLPVWERCSVPLLIAAIGLLLAVLVPGVGREVNGSMRWIGLGPISVQSSEPAKLCLIAYLAGYLVRHGDKVRNSFAGFIRPIGVVTLAAGLLLLEPDYGAAAVMFAACCSWAAFR
jgi:cell division protein FtsW